MKRLTKPFLGTLATVALMLCASSRIARADEHVLILLDVTGSMSLASTTTPGITRLDVAKQRIATFLDAVPPVTRKFALWYFDATHYTSVYPFSANMTAAQVKAQVLTATYGGVTPLAHSICAAVDELVAYKPSEFHQKRVYLATDGEENATPTTDQCYGPSSTTAYPMLTSGSWQWKVLNKACTGNPNTPGICSAGIPPGNITLTMDIDHLFTDYVSLRAATAMNPETGKYTSSAITSLGASADAALFGGLSAQTGGRYMGITQSTPLATAAPLPGDVNRDGCVNVYDYSLLLQYWGTSYSNADFNRDGIVNIYDYQTVLQNWGRCS
ncbi:MAG TPA: dockerin type I domain-containing protein [Kofleriaceae bacterium]|nr:dockerin type I domain-containing protein [Kofleriaceae bacterium]